MFFSKQNVGFWFINSMPTLSTRLAVALVTFTAGVAVTLIWVSNHFRSVNPPRVLEASDTRRDEEKFSLEGWKEVEVKSKLTLELPQDMLATELIGDSDSYREAYSNKDINITIVYGEHPSCETARHLRERPTYHESNVDIDGRKAKLGIDRYNQPEPISARLCFLDPDAGGRKLSMLAFCKDDRALKTVERIFASIKFRD